MMETIMSDNPSTPRTAADLMFNVMRDLRRDVELILNGQQLQDRALLDHMAAEEIAMRALSARLAEGDKLMNQMYEQLSTLVHVQGSFTTDPHGKPDWFTHRRHHEELESRERDSKEVLQEGKKKLVGVLVEWFFRSLTLGIVAYTAASLSHHV